MADLQGPASTPVEGPDAHDAAATENPLVVGGTAQDMDDSAPPQQVGTEGDVVRAAMDRDGVFFAHPHGVRIWHVSAEHTAQQTDTTIKAAPGASLSLHICSIVLTCNAAVDVTVEESTTTLKWKYYAGGKGDGAVATFTPPLKITANTLISVTTSAAITVTLVVSGYTAP